MQTHTLSVSKYALRRALALLKCALRLSTDTGSPAEQAASALCCMQLAKQGAHCHRLYGIGSFTQLVACPPPASTGRTTMQIDAPAC